MVFSQKWDLDDIFPGGSYSPQLKQAIETLIKDITRLKETILQSSPIKPTLLFYQEVGEQLSQANAFVGCLLAQNVEDEKAEQIDGKLSELNALYENASNSLDNRLAQMSDSDFDHLFEDPELKAIEFRLRERRRHATERLPVVQENLISNLSIDGYHGWSQLYEGVIGHVVIPFEEGGKKTDLSWGQAYNKLSSPDRTVRKQVFDNSNAVWSKNQNVFGPILNHIVGYRLKLYESRGWPTLKEPLDLNRMQHSTLETMWGIIEKNKAPFTKYMQRKAELLGVEKLSWYDLEAPFPRRQQASAPLISYQEGAELIIEKFSAFSPKMGQFARLAFEQKWIESEDRKGKRPGGFCTELPLNKASRIFMTYAGTKESLLTLAHELGHAFHNYVIFNQPEMNRHFPMSLAETASTFAEMILSEATFQSEKNLENKIAILDGKVQRSLIFIFNIHARFLFDVRLHEERKKGILSAEELGKLMEGAQKEAYCNTLDIYHPYFWASKGHFNFTGIPFYNFPYTFGFLFSLGIYLRSKEDKNFEEKYIALLSETGKMDVETLAKKHLNVDLGKETFWQQVLDFLKEEVDQFLQLTK